MISIELYKIAVSYLEELTHVDMRNFVLFRTRSCFSALYFSVVTKILIGCCSQISWTSSALCLKVLSC